jgi:hypothetical protein
MYKIDVLVQGFPGKAVCHGGLGWSTVTLIRGGGRVMLLDVGAFGVRRELLKQLGACGVTPADVTDVVLTHAHYDHAVNFVLFPQATVWIGAAELAWAAAQPPGFDPLPELYVRELERSPRVRRVTGGDEFLCMRLDEAGQPEYVGERRAAIAAWFSQTLAATTTIDLCAGAPLGLFTSLTSGAHPPSR